jgi:aspartyl-tRNA(Asn)/glutamyl-tRNA(Gln) amidotransferase subunit C
MASSITEKDVRHVARLSRLKLTDEQVARFTHELAAVLGYVSKLEELNVDEVEPLAHPHELRNVLREDVPAEPMAVGLILRSAPDKSEPFFKVIKVLGEGSGA